MDEKCRAAMISSTELEEAISTVKGIGEACVRCGWTSDIFLWATSNHILRLRHLQALVEAIEKG